MFDKNILLNTMAIVDPTARLDAVISAYKVGIDSWMSVIISDYDRVFRGDYDLRTSAKLQSSLQELAALLIQFNTLKAIRNPISQETVNEFKS